jgi:hypothetical protein
VALHRAAYLLHADPRLRQGRGRVLFVGPHQRYLADVADVLPGLGEEGVQTCTLRDLVAEGASARRRSTRRSPRSSPWRRSSVRSSPPSGSTRSRRRRPRRSGRRGRRCGSVPRTGPRHSRPPSPGHLTTRPASRCGRRSSRSWSTSTRGASPRRSCARLVRSSLEQDQDLRRACSRAWPLLEATDLVGDLWSVQAEPAPLRAVADGRAGPAAAAPGRARLDAVGPAAAGRCAPAARRPGGGPAPAPARRRGRSRARAPGRGRGRPAGGRRRR